VRGPLETTRVVEMASFISGPYAAMLLSDLGAEVVKVELPGSGDPFRQWGEREGAVRPQFAAYNRGKKSVTIDVRKPAGRALFTRLASGADVVIENFRPGTADELGIGYEALRATNERLVYCAISGMGASGPYRDRPTYDAIAQAMSGLWSVLTDTRDPHPIGPPMADQLTGLYAALGVVAALAARERTGCGQKLETSMLAAGVAFMTEPLAGYTMTGEIADQHARPRRSQSYAFVAGDGLPLAIHLSSPPKFWEALTEAVGLPELRADPRFRTKADRIRGYGALHAALQERIRTKPRAQWLATLERHDVPVAPISNIAEVAADPQTAHLGLVRSFGSGERAVRLVGFPLAFEGTPAEHDVPPPGLGEHNAEVFGALGHDAGEIERLHASGAV
jgi:crotonobetainyl-CoA:carnitine CoA-transferase CaiB-like acyl-CoA transferase